MIAAHPASIAVNGRYRTHRITGVQRYANEIVSRIESSAEVLVPRNGKRALGHLWEQTALPFLCRRRILWCPSASGPMFYRRQVVTVHDLFALEHPEWYSQSYARWYGVMMTSLIRNALALIAVSQFTKYRLVQKLGCAPDKITVIHNGLTTGVSRTASDKIAAARRALRIPPGPYVLSLSSLETRKNLGATLAAWRLLQGRPSTTATLILAGAAPDPAIYAAQKLPIDLPKVHCTGYVPEEHLAALYSGASLFVFPSLAEGFGIPLLEAMACGVQCIASSNSSLTEVGGDMVTYVDPLQPSSIATAIEKLLHDGASPDRPFEPAIKRARLFSWDGAAAQTLNILERCAHQVSPGHLPKRYHKHAN